MLFHVCKNYITQIVIASGNGVVIYIGVMLMVFLTTFYRVVIDTEVTCGVMLHQIN